MNSDMIILICTVVGTGLAVVAAMAGLFSYYAKKESEHAVNVKRLDDVEKKSNELPCIIHHSDITAIKSILIQKYPNAANVFSMKSSPRKLNDIGDKVFKEINGDDFLKENEQKLFEYIDKNEPLRALDVEQHAYAALLYYTTTPMFNRMKDYVYNAPSLFIEKDGEKGRYDIALSDICYILSIPLRDMYLNNHQEIL